MKNTYRRFDCIIAAVMLITVLIAAVTGIAVMKNDTAKLSGQYRVDINRIRHELAEGREVSAGDYESILGIYRSDGEDFFDSENQYEIIESGGELYRVEYTTEISAMSSRKNFVLICAGFAAVFIAVTGIMIYIRQMIIKPFVRLSSIPSELAKGNLTAGVEESKNRYFGKFLWGVNMLREQLETSKKHELERIRNEKTSMLSLSHDVKTPLSAIKLYSKALIKGLYTDEEKLMAAAENIGLRADEIEEYINEMARRLSTDFLEFDKTDGEFYLSETMNMISSFYSEKLADCGTAFSIEKYTDCILKGSSDRLNEVLQNIIENAIKYGDGRSISVTFSDEEECRLVTVTNTGCTLSENELDHIFESFWRGSNSSHQSGSGLGLYICRRLMNCMDGEIFADIADSNMCVTIVCRKS